MKIQNFFDQHIAQNLLFQKRYDSLFNSQTWLSDSSKGSVTPTFWPSHSVKLLYVLPNYPFSNLDCSGLEWQNFLKLGLVVSKYPKFKNWAKFFQMVFDFIYFTLPQTLGIILAFCIVPALTKLAFHFGLSLSHYLSDMRLPYRHLKRVCRPFIWSQ